MIEPLKAVVFHSFVRLPKGNLVVPSWQLDDYDFYAVVTEHDSFQHQLKTPDNHHAMGKLTTIISTRPWLPVRSRL